MKLTPGNGTPYTTSNESPDRQTFVAHNAQPSMPLSFTISGIGTLPADKDDQSNGQAPNAGPMQGGSGGVMPETQNTNPGRGLQNPLDPDNERNPLGKYQWWILGGLVIVLAIGAGVLLRKPAAAAALPDSTPTPQPLTTAKRHDILLQALKEELFSLETDHLQNRISEAEYLQQKSALETVLRRALNRNESRTV